MSITDELRGWGYGFCGDTHDVVTAIADRIDAEHERELAEQQDSLTVGMQPMTDADLAEHGLVRLPKDKDGVTIRVGDTLDGDGETTVVRRLTLGDDGWSMTCENGLWFGFDAFTHHEPTVEDVLRDFAYGLGVPVADSYIAASAAKLRLAGEGE